MIACQNHELPAAFQNNVQKEAHFLKGPKKSIS